METKDGFNSGGLADAEGEHGNGIYLTPNKKLAEMYATKFSLNIFRKALCNRMKQISCYLGCFKW